MSNLYFDRMVEQLYELDRDELRQLAREAALLSDGPDHVFDDRSGNDPAVKALADNETRLAAVRACGQPAPADLDHMTAAELAALSEIKAVPAGPLPASRSMADMMSVDRPLPFALDDQGRLREVHDRPVTVIAAHQRRDGRACLWVGCRTIEPHGWCPDRCQAPDMRPEVTGS